MTSIRTLVLLRHAKSGYPGGVRDHDRPLADRGRHEGALAGDWLRRHVPPVDEVLCSTALRAQQTVAVAGLRNSSAGSRNWASRRPSGRWCTSARSPRWR